ncbi:hypothetical protein [Paenibacillus spongiae]|uniref:YfhD family protein n=1 Tax=Paenibacillus spongiae TaxID=2909671 RepID=A0ABY5SG64_9BACL|nr:hypothetical protein [Paenibacillus spongiae]UVI32979.1 hypothetical protein L1F29_14580 [Paenibacillus spongiae]
MSHRDNQPTKAEVQSTKANKMPVPGADDTEFSAEEAAEVFTENQSYENEEEAEEI